MTPVRQNGYIKSMPSVPRIMAKLDEIKADLETATFVELEQAAARGAVDVARAFVALRQLKDYVDNVFDPLGKKYEETKVVTLPQKFESEGVPTVHLDEGFRVTVSHQMRASVKGGQKEAAFEWLRNNGLGDIVTETVNASTLSALARSMTEENRELDGDLFNVAILANTSVTKT